MKSRRGFVSNSSSSSFILCRQFEDDDKPTTTTHIAIKMLVTLQQDDEDFGDNDADTEWRTQRNASIRAAKKTLEHNTDYDGPIYFPWSCNYETYIYVHPDRPGEICVDTCNNHWWQELKYYDRNNPDSLNEYGDIVLPPKPTQFLDLSRPGNLAKLLVDDEDTQLEFNTLGKIW